jgi:4-amino-4-deoxy-L-arabinose transferase-like glycosyltransferase
MPELPSWTARLRVSLGAIQGARWAAIAWIVVFWRLGYTTLLDPDEAHYAELTREMLHSGSWLVPLLDGRPFIDKPVLFHWLQGLSMALLGDTEFAVRLPSALAAMALFAATRRIGTALLGKDAGEWGAIMFATIPATFALASIGLFDMVFAALLFGGLGCLLISAKDARPRLERGGYALLALAVMTKGPLALVLVGLFLAAAWLAGGELRAYVRRLNWGAGLLLATLAASPWFVWMHGRFGPAFVQGYVLAGNVFYLTQPDSFSGRSVNHAFYLRALAGAFFPWTLVMAGRAVDLLRRRRTGLEWPVEEKLLWLWVALVVAFFSVARFKLDHYIFPAAPACCLIAAKAWRDAAAARSPQVLGTRISVLALAAILVAGGAFAATSIFELDLDLPAAAIMLPIVLALGGVALLARAARVGWHVPSGPAAVLATMLASYCLIVTIGFPTLQRTRPTALAGRTLRQMTAPDMPAAIYRLEPWRASLRYYAERPLTRLSTPEEVAAFVSPERPVYILMIRRDYRELRQRGLALREVFKCRAVVGTTRIRAGLRRQQWDDLIIVTDAPERRRRLFTP